MSNISRDDDGQANDLEIDSDWYLDKYKDVASSGQDPKTHYLNYGRAEGRFPSAQAERVHKIANSVDPSWYYEKYRDNEFTKMEAVEHFLNQGIYKGYFPNADAEKSHELAQTVDDLWYSQRYPDIASADALPKEHYIMYGYHEGRHPNAISEHLSIVASYSIKHPQQIDRSNVDVRGRILLIDNLLPLQIYGAGFPRTQTMLKSLLNDGFAVTYYPTMQTEISDSEFYQDRLADAEYVLGIARPSIVELLEVRRNYYNCLIVCRPNNMKALQEIRLRHSSLFENVAIIYDAEAICTAREVSRLALIDKKMEPTQIAALYREEIELSNDVEATLVVNELEAKIFEQYGRSNIFVLGHSIDPTPGPVSFYERKNFLFVGRLAEDESPNVHALHWFATGVMPILIDMIPWHFEVIVVGINAATSLHDIASDRIRFMGPRSDLTPFYDNARVFIAPSQFAAGIPIKVLEAAAHGVPSVISDLLDRQLDWPRDGGYLSASDTIQFARQCTKLYTEQPLWNLQRNKALQNVSHFCSKERFSNILSSVVLGAISRSDFKDRNSCQDNFE